MGSLGRGLWLLLPVVLLLVTGCTTGQGPGEVVSVRDSAGVSIVTINAAPATLPLRTLDSVPLVVVEGGVNGVADFEGLGAVRWLADRRILVADWGASTVHLFTPSGEVIRSFGRRGDGPGEFREIRAVTILPGDTVAMYDHPHRRLEVFDAEGGHVRTVPMPGQVSLTAFPMNMYALGEGRYLAQRYQFHDSLLTPGLEIQRSLSFEDLVLFDAAGGVLDSTPTIPGQYGAWTAQGDTRAPWSHRPFAAMDGERIVSGSGETWEIIVRERGLRPMLMIRWPDAEERLTSEEVDDYAQAVRAVYPPSIPAERVDRDLATIFSPAILPTWRPAIGRVILDPGGPIWAGRFEPFWWPLPWDPVEWVILTAEGVPTGRVNLPPGIRVEEVRGDTLLVVEKDSLDVERVAVYRLQRNSH